MSVGASLQDLLDSRVSVESDHALSVLRVNRSSHTELRLIQAVIHAWNGLPNGFFQMNAVSKQVEYVHRASLLHVSDSCVISAVDDFCRLLNLQRKIRAFIDSYGQADGSYGRCVQSFCACLRSILDRYDQIFLQYENEVRKQLHHFAQPVLKNPPPLDVNIPITLISLQTYLAPYIKQMPLIADIVDRCPQPPTAASLLSLLYSSLQLHTLICSPPLSSLLFCLFLSALLPYLQYLDDWTQRGHLSERKDVTEFMVERTAVSVSSDADAAIASVGEGGDFAIRRDKDGKPLVPSFLLPHARQIFLTGRSRAMVTAMKRLYQHSGTSNPAIQVSTTASSHPNLFESFHQALWKLFHLAPEDVASLAQSSPAAATSSAGTTDASNDAPRTASRVPSIRVPNPSMDSIVLLPSVNNQTPRIPEDDGGAASPFDSQQEESKQDNDENSEIGSHDESSSSGEEWSEDDSVIDDDDDGGEDEKNAHRDEEGSDRDNLHSESDSDSVSEDSSATPSQRVSTKSSRAVSRTASQAPSRSHSPRASKSGFDAMVVRGSRKHKRKESSEQQQLAVIAKPMNEEEKEVMGIFLQTDFDTIHPWLRPPPEENAPPSGGSKNSSSLAGQPVAPNASSSSTINTPATSTSANAFNIPTSALKHEPLIPCIQTSLRASCEISFLPPVVSINSHTLAASAHPFQPPTVEVYETVTKSTEEMEAEEFARSLWGGTPAPTVKAVSKPSSGQQQQSAQSNVAPVSASQFLAQLPMYSDESGLNALVDYLLFYSEFPTYVLHSVIPQCLLAPLHVLSTQTSHLFIQTIIFDCDLVSHVEFLRHFFLMSDGVLSQEYCTRLFQKLDSWDLGVIGFNQLLQDSMQKFGKITSTIASASGSLERNDAKSRRDHQQAQRDFSHLCTLVLIHDSNAADGVTGSSNPHASSYRGSEEAESIALEHPHSILCLEQLHVLCEIPWPLNHIITPQAIQCYNRIWRFLLQLKRAEFALNECALSSTSAAPPTLKERKAAAAAAGIPMNSPIYSSASLSFASMPNNTSNKLQTSSVKYYRNISTVQHSFYLLKHELTHFLHHIIDYVLSKTTRDYFQELMQELDAAANRPAGATAADKTGGGSGTSMDARTNSTLEDLQQLHQAYLDRLMFQILMTPKLAAAAGAIKRILGLCLDLRLLYRTVLVDYMEGKASDYYFVPPASSPSGVDSSPNPQAWSSYTGRSSAGGGSSGPPETRPGTRRGSMVDENDGDENDAPRGSSSGVTPPAASPYASTPTASNEVPPFDRPPASNPNARRIALPGVSNFTQFQTRLYSTAMEQMSIIRNEFRQNLRFILILLTKIVENGVNTHLQDLLIRLNFNDFYHLDM